jgi:hypothetical protein
MRMVVRLSIALTVVRWAHLQCIIQAEQSGSEPVSAPSPMQDGAQRGNLRHAEGLSEVRPFGVPKVGFQHARRCGSVFTTSRPLPIA